VISVRVNRQVVCFGGCCYASASMCTCVDIELGDSPRIDVGCLICCNF
jgi:hypothetical protein